MIARALRFLGALQQKRGLRRCACARAASAQKNTETRNSEAVFLTGPAVLLTGPAVSPFIQRQLACPRLIAIPKDGSR